MGYNPANVSLINGCKTDLDIPIDYIIKEPKIDERKIVSLDPGYKTFITGTDLDGKAFKIGEDCMTRIKRCQKLEDEYLSLMTKFKNKRKKEENLGKKRTLISKVVKTKQLYGLIFYKKKNLITELHYKTIRYLLDNYDVIVHPQVNINSMTKKLNHHLIIFLIAYYEV
jgi:putative transposase